MTKYKNFEEYVNSEEQGFMFDLLQQLNKTLPNPSSYAPIYIDTVTPNTDNILELRALILKCVPLLSYEAPDIYLFDKATASNLMHTVERILTQSTGHRSQLFFFCVDMPDIEQVKRIRALIKNSEDWEVDNILTQLLHTLYSTETYAVSYKTVDGTRTTLCFMNTPITSFEKNKYAVLEVLIYFYSKLPKEVRTNTYKLFVELHTTNNIDETIKNIKKKCTDEEFVLKERCINTWYNKQKELEDVIKSYEEKLFATNTTIRDYTNYIKDKQEDVTNYQNKIIEVKDRLLTLKEEGPDYSIIVTQKEMVKNLLSYVSKYLSHLTVDVDTLEQKVHIAGATHLTEWDPDKIDVMLEEFNTDPLPKLALLWACFIQKKYEVPVYTECDLNYRKKTIDAYIGEDTAVTRLEPETKNIYHPHLMRFDCWGSHEYAIKEFLDNNDLEGAVTQVNYAMTQINLTDDCVVRVLVNYCLDNAESSLYDTVEKKRVYTRSVLRQIIKDFMQTDYYEEWDGPIFDWEDIDFCREYETEEETDETDS